MTPLEWEEHHNEDGSTHLAAEDGEGLEVTITPGLFYQDVEHCDLVFTSGTLTITNEAHCVAEAKAMAEAWREVLPAWNASVTRRASEAPQ